MISDFVDNRILQVSLAAWALAQIIKVVIVIVQKKQLSWHHFITSGGMPSSHTSTVCALATSIAMTFGVGSVYFSIAAVFAAIVMYDAAGVRQSVGQHSAVLNRIVREITFKASMQEVQKELKEFIGHTPFQVLMGAVLGILIGWGWITLSN